MQSEKTVTVLNDLIQISEDGKKGFSDAAGEATTADLKTMFKARAADCASAAAELKGMVESLGGKPKGGGTFAGAVHRGWAKVTASVGDANLSTLEELERAEGTAKQAYTNALTEKLPGHVREVVQRQHDGTVRNHHMIRDARNSYTAQKETASP